MEIALDPGFPTYSGGLGMLAGDTIRAAADLGAPMVAVTLAHRLGYFRQQLDGNGTQTELPDPWHPETELEAVDARALVILEQREVHIRAWRYVVRGITGSTIPVYLLDTNLPANAAEDRRLTDALYGGDDRYRLRQESVLGLGGIALFTSARP
jgi:starch phosphorylase